jgi:hypothetical protein
MKNVIIKATQNTLEKKESLHNITPEELKEALNARTNGVQIPQPMEIIEVSDAGN